LNTEYDEINAEDVESESLLPKQEEEDEYDELDSQAVIDSKRNQQYLRFEKRYRAYLRFGKRGEQTLNL
jgi:hypothetical protein